MTKIVEEPHSAPFIKKAAVLIPVFTSPGLPFNQSEILFTIRTDTVEHHKGQISFPGGHHERTDGSLQETALRETEEETGIPRSAIQVVAELEPVFIPVTKFNVTPFVGHITGNPQIILNIAESREIIKVPIHHLLEPTNQKLETYEYNGVRFELPAFYFNEHRIWGATARMLSQYLQKLTQP